MNWEYFRTSIVVGWKIIIIHFVKSSKIVMVDVLCLNSFLVRYTNETPLTIVVTVSAKPRSNINAFNPHAVLMRLLMTKWFIIFPFFNMDFFYLISNSLICYDIIPLLLIYCVYVHINFQLTFWYCT